MPDPFVYLPPGRLDAAVPGTHLEADPEEDHHLRTVLRLGPGAPVELCDGRGVTAPARLAAAAVEVVGEPVLHPAPATAIEVVHALPKGRKLDDVVRVLTELGVDRLRPVASARSVVRLDGARRARASARWRAVARAAGSQSRRPRLPVVEEPGELAPSAAGDLGPDVAPDGAWLLVAHVGAPTGIATALATTSRAGPAATRADGPGSRRSPRRVVLAIGPEGGWTDGEVAQFVARGGQPVHLGPAVLRTEHAAAVAVAVAAAAVGRMD